MGALSGWGQLAYPPNPAGGGSPLPTYVGRTVMGFGSGDVDVGDLTAITGLASGDLLIAAIERNRSDGNPDPAADWTDYTAIRVIHTGSNSENAGLHVLFHEYDGTDPDLVFLDNGGNHIAVIIYAFRGVTNVINLGSDNDASVLTSHTMASKNTNEDNSLVLAFAAGGDDVDVSNIDIANVTTTALTTTTDQHAVGNDGVSIAGYGPLATAGATGDFTFDSNATVRTVRLLLELQG